MNEWTDIGGPNGGFRTTQWTDISPAGSGNPEKSKQALATVYSQYWKPVYAYLRSKGYPNNKAKDLTQEFFVELVIKRNLIEKADPRKGKFRNYLLTSLERFLKDCHRYETAKKRKPNEAVASLDCFESADSLIVHESLRPEDELLFHWARELIEDVSMYVRNTCCSTGQQKHWTIFDRVFLSPHLHGTESPSYSELCKELDIESESKASNMNITVKRRFKSALWAKIRETVTSDSLVEDEINELKEILSRCGAG